MYSKTMDGKYGVTVAVETMTDYFDKGEHLFPRVDQAIENTGKNFENIIADCGFCNFERLSDAEEKEKNYYLPDQDYKKEYK